MDLANQQQNDGYLSPDERLAIMSPRFYDRSERVVFRCQRRLDANCGPDLFKRSFEEYELIIRYHSDIDRIVVSQKPLDGMDPNSKWRVNCYLNETCELKKIKRPIGYMTLGQEVWYDATDPSSSYRNEDANFIIDDLLTELKVSGELVSRERDPTLPPKGDNEKGGGSLGGPGLRILPPTEQTPTRADKRGTPKCFHQQLTFNWDGD